MIIKNCTAFVDDEFQKMDLRIENGTIAEIGVNLVGDDKVHDCNGMIVSPAFVDLHTHLRIGQEYKEDPQITVEKAIRGGYCAINVMRTLFHL